MTYRCRERSYKDFETNKGQEAWAAGQIRNTKARTVTIEVCVHTEKSQSHSGQVHNIASGLRAMQ